MKYLLILGIFTLLAISSCKATDLKVGDSANAHLAWVKNLEHTAVPLIKRVKDVAYNNPDQQNIKAIIAKDANPTSTASCAVDAGGVGLPFVTLHCKSERGEDLKFVIEIYV